MVLRLSAALDLPLRQSNELLLGAGFAPAWAQTDFRAAPLAPVREALIYILDQQEPYPAVVVDRHWNLLQANNGAVGLVEFLVGPIAPGTAINLADALVGPDVLRPHLVNWGEVVRYFIRSVEADAAADTTTETANLLERLLGYKDVRAATKHAAISADGPILPMHFRKGRTELRLFTTIHERHTTSRCRNCGSRAFFRWTRRHARISEGGLEARPSSGETNRGRATTTTVSFTSASGGSADGRDGSNSVLPVMSAARSLFPRKRKSIRDLAMSHKCQKRSSANFSP